MENSPHEISGVLKLFFRQLQSPLIPLRLISDDFESIPNGDKKNFVKGLLLHFRIIESSQKTYETLKFLCKHFKKYDMNADKFLDFSTQIRNFRVVSFEEYNKVSAETISIVIGPSICYDEGNFVIEDLCAISKLPNQFIQYLIENYDELFSND